jgi:hypothetical protein
MSSTVPTPTSAPRASGQPVLMILGVVLAMIGLPLLLAGGGLAVALAVQTDDDGFFVAPTQQVTTSTAAVTSPVVDLGAAGTDEVWSGSNLATVRIEATSVDGEPVFVGIGPSSRVDSWLAGVAHDEVTDVAGDPFSYQLTRRDGDPVAAPAPDEASFWAASATGSGTQTLDWNLEAGSWTVVVLNADGSPGVSVDLAPGGRFALLAPIAVALALFGLVLVVGGALFVVLGARTGTPPTPRVAEAAVPGGVAATTPVRLTGHLDPRLSRWLWLVKWLLAIPHFILLALLWVVFVVLTFGAFVSIAITGRYPRGLFDLNVGILRWTWRVQFYATGALGTDRYPPFSLEHVDYPADLDVAYPERLSRGLVWVKSWLLAIPHLVILAILAGQWGWVMGENGIRFSVGGLIGALTLAAALLLLFIGRYPTPLFDLVIGLNRWAYRVIAYVALMTDEYPPFRLDQGPEEPAPTGGPVAPTSDEPQRPAEHGAG